MPYKREQMHTQLGRVKLRKEVYWRPLVGEFSTA